MRYISITADDNLYLPFINSLYHEAFPLHERRDWEQLINLMKKAAEMQVQVIVDEENPIGFIIFWIFRDWSFIEHFAIDPAYRGMKYGERVISDFTHKGNVLLEVEPPDVQDAIRRVNFYERLGLELLPLTYHQPSYREAGVTYEMKLMSNRPENERNELNIVLSAVLKAVYRYEERSPE